MNANADVTDLEDINGILSENVRNLRAMRELTLDELSARAELSKGMVVKIEQGRTNPSIGTLCKLANALGVTINRLIEETGGPALKKVTLSDLPNLWKGKTGSSAKLLAGVDSSDLIEFWDWKLRPGHHHDSLAHPQKTKEILYVLSGVLNIEVGASSTHVKAGESLLLPADQNHRYANESDKIVHFAMVVIEPILS